LNEPAFSTLHKKQRRNFFIKLIPVLEEGDVKEIREDDKTDKKKFPCLFCTQMTNTSTAMTEHTNNCHRDEAIKFGWIECSICELMFPIKSFTHHMSKSHRRKKLEDESQKSKCKFCQRTFGNTNTLFMHVNSLHRDEAHQDGWPSCIACSKLFPNDFALILHIKKSHLKLNKDQSVPEEKVEENDFLEIKKEEEEYDDGFIQQHLCITLHEGSEEPDVDDDRNEEPDVDNEIVPSTSNCPHLQIKFKQRVKLECVICQESFQTSDEFHQHTNQFHRDEGWPACPDCLMVFMPSAVVCDTNRKVDKEIQPVIDKPVSVSKHRVQCGFCSISLSNTAHLYRHANQVHKKEALESGWVECHFCGQLLPSQVLNFHLRRKHKNKMEEEIPKCMFCSNIYKDGWFMYTHVNKFHREDALSSGWFECPHCQKLLPTDVAMTFHISASHSNVDKEKHGKQKRKRVKDDIPSGEDSERGIEKDDVKIEISNDVEPAEAKQPKKS